MEDNNFQDVRNRRRRGHRLRDDRRDEPLQLSVAGKSFRHDNPQKVLVSRERLVAFDVAVSKFNENCADVLVLPLYGPSDTITKQE
jgi:hypothetical protein